MAPSSDARDRLVRAGAARREGRYAEALAHHVWFHENALAEDPAWHGVRLSFALADWAELAQVYPPALEALTAARDQPRERLLAGTGDWDEFAEVAALNDLLGEPGDTRDLFRRLDATRPELASTCRDIALPVLVAHGDHELARRHVGDPDVFVRRNARAITNTLADVGEVPEPGDPLRMAMLDRYVDHIRLLLTVLRAVGEHDAARNAHVLAISAVEDTETRQEIAARLDTV